MVLWCCCVVVIVVVTDSECWQWEWEWERVGMIGVFPAHLWSRRDQTNDEW